MKQAHPEVSFADLYSFAGVVAIEFLGGPKVLLLSFSLLSLSLFFDRFLSTLAAPTTSTTAAAPSMAASPTLPRALSTFAMFSVDLFRALVCPPFSWSHVFSSR